MGHALGGEHPVMQFPGPLKLVQVLGAHMVHVFLQHLKQFQSAVEHRRVGRVVGADAADILVHDLFEALEPVDRQEVAGGNRAGDDLVPADRIVLHRLVDRLFERPVFLFVDLRRLVAQIVDIVDRGFAGDAAFGERAG